MNAVHYEPIRKVTASHYPNAADRRYRLDRLADILLSTAICIGIAGILFFLVTLA